MFPFRSRSKKNLKVKVNRQQKPEANADLSTLKLPERKPRNPNRY